jgi:pimeloyl-ACP methyl ester carboxylesterase
VFTVTSADGTDVRAYDEGKGPAIVMLGPRLDDGTRTKKLAAILAGRYRVLRLHRRQYRLDLKADPKLGGSPVSIAQEVEDVVAIVRAIGGPVLLYGHSDGGVVALEALAASPSSFAGAVVFEPAAVIDADKPLAGKDGRVLAEARATLAAGRPGKAAAICPARLPARRPFRNECPPTPRGRPMPGETGTARAVGTEVGQ